MRAWKDFLTRLEDEIGKEPVDRWLRTLHVVNFDAGNLYLEARDSFQALWFEEHARKHCNQKFLNNNGRQIRIHLRVSQGAFEKKSAKSKSKKKEEESPSSQAFHLTFDQRDPYCTLENLILTKGNQLALRLIGELVGYDPIQQKATKAEPTLGNLNPIYIWGSGGTGKSHLLMGLSAKLEELGYKALYARAETFTEHVVGAIRAGEMHAFRQAYRSVDVLLLDGVQIFSKKAATQEELFHTFNTLHVEGKQIILTANSSPGELQSIEPRLVSRFEWGIALPIEKPSKEELRLILEKKAQVLGYQLSGRIADFLLETFTSGAQALIRALEALVLRGHLNRTSESLPSNDAGVLLAKKYLNDLIESEKRSTLTSDKILTSVAEHYGVRVEDILGKSQSRECVIPRKIAMQLCRSKLQMPYTKIGELFSRDHSTVLASVRQVDKEVEERKGEMASALPVILQKLQTV